MHPCNYKLKQMKKPKLGQTYSYQEIEDFAYHHSESEELNAYGPELIGKLALHVEDGGKDYWFVMDGATAKAYYLKCVIIV